MNAFLDISKMLAGVAVFLLGMNFMEETLRLLTGRKFKIFLKRQTANKLKAIGGGAIATGMLQSSSVVNLLVLSMVGAGVIQMQNALAIVLGANLGTTLNSWVVMMVGFTVSIDQYAFSVAGITGIGLAFVSKSGNTYQWLKFFLGLSFLFLGLGFIKDSMQDVINSTNLSALNHYPIILFFGLGILLTAIVQSSSATIALTLSALYADGITLYMATAIVLGAEIGTTLKLFPASARGIPAKKRVALGNFMFNAVTVVIMFILLKPLNWFITDIISIKDNLIALVFFQSLINLVSIVLFYPFLDMAGRTLEKRFVRENEESLFINKLPVADTALALDALEKETGRLIFLILDFSVEAFAGNRRSATPKEMFAGNFDIKPLGEKYDYIKRLHGEIYRFYIQLQNESTVVKETERLEQLISSVRNCMYAAKNVRDALHDIAQLRNSSNDTKYKFYLETVDKMVHFSEKVTVLMERQKKTLPESLTGIYQDIQSGYNKSLQQLYKKGIAREVSTSEISTLINYNREMYTAFKSIVFAMKDYLLPGERADYFESLPGFIR